MKRKLEENGESDCSPVQKHIFMQQQQQQQHYGGGWQPRVQPNMRGGGGGNVQGGQGQGVGGFRGRGGPWRGPRMPGTHGPRGFFRGQRGRGGMMRYPYDNQQQPYQNQWHQQPVAVPQQQQQPQYVHDHHHSLGGDTDGHLEQMDQSGGQGNQGGGGGSCNAQGNCMQGGGGGMCWGQPHTHQGHGQSHGQQSHGQPHGQQGHGQPHGQQGHGPHNQGRRQDGNKGSGNVINEDPNNSMIMLEGSYTKTKVKRRPMSQNYSSKPWNREDAERALAVESAHMKGLRNQSLIIRFPDPELSKDMVKNFHPGIENVHFQVPSGPRYCFVQLAEDVNPDSAIEELSQIKFGSGKLFVEKKFSKDEEDLSPEAIDPYTLYIGNLPTNVNVATVKEKFPTATRVDVGFAQRMKFTRYAFIRYTSVDDAIQAYKRTHNLILDSRSIIVRFRRVRGPVGLPGESRQQKPPKAPKKEAVKPKKEKDIEEIKIKEEDKDKDDDNDGDGDDEDEDEEDDDDDDDDDEEDDDDDDSDDDDDDDEDEDDDDDDVGPDDADDDPDDSIDEEDDDDEDDDNDHDDDNDLSQRLFQQIDAQIEGLG